MVVLQVRPLNAKSAKTHVWQMSDRIEVRQPNGRVTVVAVAG